MGCLCFADGFAALRAYSRVLPGAVVYRLWQKGKAPLVCISSVADGICQIIADNFKTDEGFTLAGGIKDASYVSVTGLPGRLANPPFRSATFGNSEKTALCPFPSLISRINTSSRRARRVARTLTGRAWLLVCPISLAMPTRTDDLGTGQRIAAGLPPFKRHVRLERYED